MCKNMQCIELIIIACLIVLVTSCSKKDQASIDYTEQIKNYLLLLEEDPDNCEYIDQVGASYQMLYDEKNAIKYYEMLVDKCPGGYWEIQGHWKMGLSYVVMGQVEGGLKLIDKAIEMAKESEDEELYNSYLLEKEALKEKYLK